MRSWPLWSLESSDVDTPSTDLCNEVFEKVHTPSPKGKEMGGCQVLSPAHQAEVGKYASQHSGNFLRLIDVHTCHKYASLSLLIKHFNGSLE